MAGYGMKKLSSVGAGVMSNKDKQRITNVMKNNSNIRPNTNILGAGVMTGKDAKRIYKGTSADLDGMFNKQGKHSGPG